MQRLTTRNSMGVAVLKQSYKCERCGEAIWRLSDYGNGEPIEKLAEYEDLQERLYNVYGECSGLLETIVKCLEIHENINLPIPVIKSTLLTDETVDEWEEYKSLKEQGKLLKLPCAVGSLVYEPYQFMGDGAWEIDVHKIMLEDLENIGKTVFLTREEAEATLEVLNGGQGKDRKNENIKISWL